MLYFYVCFVKTVVLSSKILSIFLCTVKGSGSDNLVEHEGMLNKLIFLLFIKVLLVDP